MRRRPDYLPKFKADRELVNKVLGDNRFLITPCTFLCPFKSAVCRKGEHRLNRFGGACGWSQLATSPHSAQLTTGTFPYPGPPTAWSHHPSPGAIADAHGCLYTHGCLYAADDSPAQTRCTTVHTACLGTQASRRCTSTGVLRTATTRRRTNSSSGAKRSSRIGG